jgi:Methyltransferase domain
MKKINMPVVVRRVTDKVYQDKNSLKIGEGGSAYFVSPSLGKNPLVYSGGVGEDISFELDLVKKFNARIFIFDPTKKAKTIMKKIRNSNIKYFQYGLSGKSGEFKIDDGETHKCISLSDFAAEHKHKKIDLLKLDIEGFEYGVLKDVLNNKNLEIGQIVLEFHGWMKGIPRSLDRIWKRELLKKNYRLFYKDIDNYTYVKA